MRENTDNRSPEEIESDIERTRADFSSTIEAIQQKLTPSELKNQAVDYALSTTPGAVGVSMVTLVRENPIPVAMIGIGFAWLMAANRQPTTYVASPRPRRGARRSTYYSGTDTAYESAYDSTYDTMADRTYVSGSDRGYSSGRAGGGMLSRMAARVSETAQSLKSRASDTAQGLKSRASDTTYGLKSRANDTAHDLRSKADDVSQRFSSTASDMSGRMQQVGETARTRFQETAQSAQARMSEMGDMSKTQYYRAKDRFDQVRDEQPLVIAALGVALGAILGAALPNTRRENELMGQTRDNLLGKVKETALEQAETVKQSAQRVAQMAKEEAARVKDDVSSSVLQSKDQGTSASGGTGSYGGLSGQQSIH